MASELKATTRMVLGDVMAPMADALDDWARRVGDARADATDPEDAARARSLAGEIRLCLGQMEVTDSLAEGEAATKRLQQLRSLALEFLAKHK